MKKSLFAFTASAILFAQAAVAENVGVTSSADPRVTEAGMEMLRQGGSAADAAMAMMLALTVVEPQSSGIGGGGFLLYQDSAKGVLTTINGRETAPAAAKADRFVGADGKPLSERRIAGLNTAAQGSLPHLACVCAISWMLPGTPTEWPP